MFNDPELDAKLAQLKQQWDIAERRIKKAENVCGQRVVTSAIFELRYAGRKLIEALHLATTEGWQSDPANRQKIGSYLDDASEDCVKAKHDAIDAMMDFVTVWFNAQENSLGLLKIQHFFPDFLQTRILIKKVQDRIEESRGDRTKLRDALYDDIEQEGYDEVLALYDRMRLSKDIIEASVSRERRGKIALWAVSIISLIIGMAGLAVGILHLFYR
jgi:hypothetical protein